MNYIEVDADATIYRITPAKYLLADIDEGRLTMTRISRSDWGDPTENPLLAAEYETTGGESLTLKSLTENMFGSCWSLRPLGTPEDWEDFSHGAFGIRICSTPRRLLQGFNAAPVDAHGALKRWIGRVNYEPIESIQVHFDDPNWEKHLDTSNRRLIETVLRLRSHWKDEREVRLVYDRLGDDWDTRHAELRPSPADAPRVAITFDWAGVIAGFFPGPGLSPTVLGDLRKAHNRTKNKKRT